MDIFQSLFCHLFSSTAILGPDNKHLSKTRISQGRKKEGTDLQTFSILR